MFKNNSIIYDVNIVCKIISMILMLTSFILLKSPVVLVFLGLFFLIISFEFRKISLWIMISILISILSSFVDGLLFIPKIILFITYICLFKKITTSTEMRYVLEKTLYKFQSKKITFRILYIIYFFKQLRENIKILDKLRNEYGMAKDFFYVRFSFKKAWKKTRHEMREIITVNDLRFYNYLKERTYLEKPTWERWDTKFLLIHIAFMVLVIVYGR